MQEDESEKFLAKLQNLSQLQTDAMVASFRKALKEVDSGVEIGM